RDASRRSQPIPGCRSPPILCRETPTAHESAITARQPRKHHNTKKTNSSSCLRAFVVAFSSAVDSLLERALDVVADGLERFSHLPGLVNRGIDAPLAFTHPHHRRLAKLLLRPREDIGRK